MSSPRCLRAAFVDRFSSYARARGRALARAGAVTIERAGSPLSLAAQVGVGRDAASVTLYAAGGGSALRVRCSCPLFALGLDGCRHVWACLAAIDAGLPSVRLRLSRTPELSPCRDGESFTPPARAPRHPGSRTCRAPPQACAGEQAVALARASPP